MSATAAGSRGRSASPRAAARPSSRPRTARASCRRLPPRSWSPRRRTLQPVRRFPRQPRQPEHWPPRCGRPTAGPSRSASTAERSSSWIWSTGRRRTRGRHEATSARSRSAPMGRRLATGGLDRTVMVWDVASGQVRETLRRPRGQDRRDCASAPTAARCTPRGPAASSRGTWRAPAGSGGRYSSSPPPTRGAVLAATRALRDQSRTAPSRRPPTASGQTRSRSRPPLPRAVGRPLTPGIGQDLGDRLRPGRQALAVGGERRRLRSWSTLPRARSPGG